MAEDQAPAQPGVPPISPAPMAQPNIKQMSNADNPEEESLPFGGGGTGIGNPIPIPQKTAEWESGYQNEHGPRPSRWESWVSAPLEEGTHDSLASPWGGALLRMAKQREAATGQMLSPEQANQIYPGRPVPYTTPVDVGTALMEANDRQKQQDIQDWAAQREPTVMGTVVSTASGFVGGLTDPLNFAIGAMSGGVGDLIAPEAMGIAGKVAAHYLANLGGFSVTDALTNMAEQRMGAKQKQLGQIISENAVPAAKMTGVGVGLSYLARGWADRGGGTSEVDIAAIKKSVADLEQGKKIPQLEDLQKAIADRRAGATVDPGGGTSKPVMLTSPLQETHPLYAATHSDGTPLTHEHGLGPGAQVTDSHEVANNGVSRSTETPGQIGETKLPAESKLLNIDRSAAEDYGSKDSFLKQVEAKTGINLEADTKSGESIKDLITKLGDWAGAEVGGKEIPESILKDIQEIAKSQGFNGYEFAGENSRQAHIFDPSGMSIEKSYHADPNATPALPDLSKDPMQGMTEAQPAQTFNAAVDKTQVKTYSPEIEQLMHEFRKKGAFDNTSPEHIAEIQKDIEGYKQQLGEMAKESSTAQEALESLKKQDVQDARLRDVAKRIAECGAGGGV